MYFEWIKTEIYGSDGPGENVLTSANADMNGDYHNFDIRTHADANAYISRYYY